jgi:hypothetical protein
LRLASLTDLAAAAVPCPSCDVALAPTSVRAAGIAIVVEATCPECGGNFAFDWPAGHALLHPVLVERHTGAVYTDGGSLWYARAFVRCLATRERATRVQITVTGECGAGRNAILVNCLDYVYSHSLLKLLSAARHLRESPGDDVVVIAPKLLRWLVPSGAVVIEVDLPLSQGTEWVEGLDSTVEEVLAPAGAVRISPAVSQPDVAPLDLTLLGEDLTPSAHPQHSAAPLQIGFSLRDDRLWLGPARRWVTIVRRLPGKRLTHRLLVRLQHGNYTSLARQLRKQHPEARLVAFGIGEPQGLPDYVDDLRTRGPVREEAAYLDEYRSCRVVVGIHGANLLLPSLLAGAVVDLLPNSKLPNINQDLIIPRESAGEPKLLLFRYRLVPEECTPDTVAAVALSVIDDADWHHRNMIDNRRAYEIAGWLQPISWREATP